VRLLVVGQYFWPESFRVNELVAELVARGHQVTVLTGVPNYPEGKVFEEYRREPGRFASYAGARIVRVPLRPRGQGSLRLVLNYASFVFWASLLGPWRLRGLRFDAIFFSETSPITSVLPALLLRRLKRAPLLLWVLDLWPETLSAVGVVRSPALLRLVGRLVSFIYRRCDLILAQSRAFYPNIVHWSGQPSKVRYFPSWTEAVFEVGLESVALASELEPFRHTFNIMFAGNIGDAQDFPAILDAAELLRARPNFRWLVVGTGRAAARVHHEIVRRGLTQCVVMLGRHSLERMPSFAKGASVLLVTLKADPVFSLTIPGKVQNYLATGIPLAGMLDGEGARVIEESGAGFACRAGDGKALANLVAKLADLDEAERAAMGVHGRAYARQEFNRSCLMKRLEGWFAEAQEAKPRLKN
jgi:glycosyltransferase involved in cell wall biosynthesis